MPPMQLYHAFQTAQCIPHLRWHITGTQAGLHFVSVVEMWQKGNGEVLRTTQLILLLADYTSPLRPASKAHNNFHCGRLHHCCRAVAAAWNTGGIFCTVRIVFSHIVMCTLLNNAQIKEFVDSQVYMCKAHDLGSATLHKIFLFSDKAHVNTSPSWTNLLLVPKF